jgi:hypothetical protein
VFKSFFKHLNDHNGFRCGELHLLVGPKGGGKSTLFRDWILESVRQGKKVYVRLSEDKRLDYVDEIAKFFNDNEGQIFKNLYVESDLDLTDDEKKDYLGDLEMKVKNRGADIIFYDNFTTSILTRQGILAEAENALKLRSLADKLEVPVVVAAHTQKSYRGDSVASGDDVRGNATLANVAAYIYGLTVFYKLPTRPTVLFIDKARHHSASNKKHYKLVFNPASESYVKDSELSPVDVKEMIKGLK